MIVVYIYLFDNSTALMNWCSKYELIILNFLANSNYPIIYHALQIQCLCRHTKMFEVNDSFVWLLKDFFCLLPNKKLSDIRLDNFIICYPTRYWKWPDIWSNPSLNINSYPLAVGQLMGSGLLKDTHSCFVWYDKHRVMLLPIHRWNSYKYF